MFSVLTKGNFCDANEIKPKGMIWINPCVFFFFSFHFSIDQCKFMDSKMRPLYLVFENLDEMGDFVRIIFKNGDGKCLL